MKFWRSHFSWQAQYLVMLEGNLCCSAHCNYHESHLTWQAQYLVKFNCHFSWQGQHVKFGMIAGARTAARATSNFGCEAGCERTVLCSDHFLIVLGSWWDHSRIMVGSAPHCK